MLYPIMPIFLKSIGFSIVLIGILEGLAEAVSGLSKGFFGQYSDSLQKKVPFVQWGYFLSALSKPMMAVWTFPAWILGARILDRLGKGLRTGARDALLSDETTPKNKGKVFGFHRSMDTLGAVIGPISALIFLAIFPGHYKALFVLAFFPGILGVLLTFFLKDKPNPTSKKTLKPLRLFSFFDYFKNSSTEYKKLVGGLLGFAIFNSSDVFLLLMMKHRGLSDFYVIAIYIFYNLIYAVFSYPMGHLGDKIGFKKTFLFGLVLFLTVYLGMGHAHSWPVFLTLFFLYGVYAASTEGIAKAWISNLCTPTQTASSIGTYTAFQSITALLASTLAGFMWRLMGAPAIFNFAAIGTLVIIVYFVFLKADRVRG